MVISLVSVHRVIATTSAYLLPASTAVQPRLKRELPSLQLPVASSAKLVLQSYLAKYIQKKRSTSPQVHKPLSQSNLSVWRKIHLNVGEQNRALQEMCHRVPMGLPSPL